MIALVHYLNLYLQEDFLLHVKTAVSFVIPVCTRYTHNHTLLSLPSIYLLHSACSPFRSWAINPMRDVQLWYSTNLISLSPKFYTNSLVVAFQDDIKTLNVAI